MDTFRVGVAVRDITPPFPVWLYGYGSRTRQSIGVAEPLTLSCLAVSNADQTVLVVACDLLGIETFCCDELYALLAAETGLRYPQVLIASSHTHFAPGLTPATFTLCPVGIAGPDPRYVADVRTKLVEAVRECLRVQQPARLETARLQAPQVGFNRRTVRVADGKVVTSFLYPEDPTPYRFSPVDSELSVLRFVGATGVLAVLVNFGCHPVTGCGDKDDDLYRISPDYPYYLRQTITARYGCPVLFTLGAAGDAVPILRRGDCRQRIGRVLGETVVLAERTYRPDGSRDLRASVAELQAETAIKLDGRQAQLDYEQAQAEVLALASASGPVAETDASRAAWARFQRATDMAFRARLYPENRFSIRVQFVKIGRTVLVALPFEVLTEISLRQKARFPDSVLVSCAGGYEAYLPLAYEYERGGYEASAEATNFVPDTGDRVLDAVLAGLDRMA